MNDIVINALRGVIDPELGDNVVDLGMVRDATVDDDGVATVTIALTVAGCPLQAQLRHDVERLVGLWAAAPGCLGSSFLLFAIARLRKQLATP